MNLRICETLDGNFFIQKECNESCGFFFRIEKKIWRDISENGDIVFPQIGLYTKIFSSKKRAKEFANRLKKGTFIEYV